mmetsp:Transcript_1669/g.3896  ORF Transcript_1669/g.3896 Transcript_1669/m.3896 type:complete len:294 (-) Transcript_1669:132-1013(-)
MRFWKFPIFQIFNGGHMRATQVSICVGHGKRFELELFARVSVSANSGRSAIKCISLFIRHSTIACLFRVDDTVVTLAAESQIFDNISVDLTVSRVIRTDRTGCHKVGLSDSRTRKTDRRIHIKVVLCACNTIICNNSAHCISESIELDDSTFVTIEKDIWDNLLASLGVRTPFSSVGRGSSYHRWTKVWRRGFFQLPRPSRSRRWSDRRRETPGRNRGLGGHGGYRWLHRWRTRRAHRERSCTGLVRRRFVTRRKPVKEFQVVLEYFRCRCFGVKVSTSNKISVVQGHGAPGQ